MKSALEEIITPMHCYVYVKKYKCVYLFVLHLFKIYNMLTFQFHLTLDGQLES